MVENFETRLHRLSVGRGVEDTLPLVPSGAVMLALEVMRTSERMNEVVSTLMFDTCNLVVELAIAMLLSAVISRASNTTTASSDHPAVLIKNLVEHHRMKSGVRPARRIASNDVDVACADSLSLIDHFPVLGERKVSGEI